jgi:hypothetical protein
MVSFVTTDLMNQLQIELSILRQEELCSKFKDHLVKNHKLFNKIRLYAKTLTVMKHFSSQPGKEITATLGLVREQVRRKQHLLIVLDQFFALEIHSKALKKVKRQKNSGQLLEEKLNTVQSKPWELLQVLNQDFSNALTALDIST